jgi:hypothetical protein
VFCCGFSLPHRVVVVADELDVFLSGVEAEGSNIPAVVPMEKSTPQAPEAAEGAPEPMEEVAEEAAAVTGGEEATMPPEVALEVAIRSPEIQDAEPIRSAPMTETASSSRGGADDVRCASSYAHVEHLCLQGSRLLEHQQRARRRRCLLGTCLGPSLKALGRRQQP